MTTLQTQTPIEIWRSEIPSSSSSTPALSLQPYPYPPTIQNPSNFNLQTMKEILKKAIPSSSSSLQTSTPPNPINCSQTKERKQRKQTHPRRPRSLSFHSPISTTSFSLHTLFPSSPSHSTSSEKTAMYSSSPSSVTSSNSPISQAHILEEDEEAIVSISDDDDDAEEKENGMQGKRQRGGLRDLVGEGVVERENFSFVQKMERLERARRLLESCGERC